MPKSRGVRTAPPPVSWPMVVSRPLVASTLNIPLVLVVRFDV
jgi:hypothetical protein